jgi:hypothetical protein
MNTRIRWRAAAVLTTLTFAACGSTAAGQTQTGSLASNVAAAPEPAPSASTSVLVLPPAAVAQATATPTAAAGFNGQSSLVPEGFPTPNTAGERLVGGGPPRDPGSLDWARTGPYFPPAWTDFGLNSFDTSQRLATTYYFYWHDLTDPARNGRYTSRQFDSPPDLDQYSFLLPETHERQFNDIVDAGLDFVLPVYWGEPGHPGRTTSQTYPHYWSTEGIPPMVQALDRLAAAGKHLQVGMFYDTTIMANADLTTPAGKDYFYVNVRDFFSRIPPKYWAAIGGKPIVWLYDTLWISKFDQSSIDYLSDRFASDFNGLRLYVVREAQWEQSKGVEPPQMLRSDGFYGWGAAPSGYNPDPKFTVAEVGPGFRNTAYCTGGPEKNCYDINRQNGAFYERQLQQAVASPHNILAVETWNEFSEGTDIAETVQYGRRYIQLTRTYADRFKATRAR